jgi:hypothetical protein
VVAVSALRTEIGIDEVLAKLDALAARIDTLSNAIQPAFYSVDQVAEMEGCHPRTISRQIARGERPVTRRGSKPMIAASDVIPAGPQSLER